jgi:hypothetical protein
MSYRFWAQTILLCTALAPAAIAGASTVQKLSFERPVDGTDIIIQGRVEEIKTREAPDRSFVSTLITITVADQFKGTKVSSVTIEQPGGSMGAVTQGAPGSPEFSPGENVIVFLERKRNEAYRIVGGKQGKFTAKAQPGSNQQIVEDFARRSETLGSFVARLKEAAKRSK